MSGHYWEGVPAFTETRRLLQRHSSNCGEEDWAGSSTENLDQHKQSASLVGQTRLNLIEIVFVIAAEGTDLVGPHLP